MSDDQWLTHTAADAFLGLLDDIGRVPGILVDGLTMLMHTNLAFRECVASAYSKTVDPAPEALERIVAQLQDAVSGPMLCLLKP